MMNEMRSMMKLFEDEFKWGDVAGEKEEPAAEVPAEKPAFEFDGAPEAGEEADTLKIIIKDKEGNKWTGKLVKQVPPPAEPAKEEAPAAEAPVPAVEEKKEPAKVEEKKEEKK